MAISNDMDTRGARRSTSHRNAAFLIEALVVLALLMSSLAVFARLFVGAQLEGIEANRKSEAVLAATSCAEVFSADPTSVAKRTKAGDLVVTCNVEPRKLDDGTLYEATIVVSHDTGEVYRLKTSRYVSGGDAT